MLVTKGFLWFSVIYWVACLTAHFSLVDFPPSDVFHNKGLYLFLGWFDFLLQLIYSASGLVFDFLDMDHGSGPYGGFHLYMFSNVLFFGLIYLTVVLILFQIEEYQKSHPAPVCKPREAGQEELIVTTNPHAKRTSYQLPAKIESTQAEKPPQTSHPGKRYRPTVPGDDDTDYEEEEETNTGSGSGSDDVSSVSTNHDGSSDELAEEEIEEAESDPNQPPKGCTPCPDCDDPKGRFGFFIGNYGNGKCSACHGTGYKGAFESLGLDEEDQVCDECGGNRECQSCNGKGYSTF